MTTSVRDEANKYRTKSRQGAPLVRVEVSALYSVPGDGTSYRKQECKGPDTRAVRAAVRAACRVTDVEVEGIFVLLYDDEGLCIDVCEFPVGDKVAEYAGAHARRVTDWIKRGMSRAGRPVWSGSRL